MSFWDHLFHQAVWGLLGVTDVIGPSGVITYIRSSHLGTLFVIHILSGFKWIYIWNTIKVKIGVSSFVNFGVHQDVEADKKWNSRCIIILLFRQDTGIRNLWKQCIQSSVSLDWYKSDIWIFITWTNGTELSNPKGRNKTYLPCTLRITLHNKGFKLICT